MNNEYQKWVEEMWFSGEHRSIEEGLTIASFGLAGETGEVMELLKKRIRDGRVIKEDLKKELGDVLYYWCRIAAYFDMTPEEIIEANRDKLNSRKERGVMRGSGDNR